jgi:hypothetical protein
MHWLNSSEKYFMADKSGAIHDLPKPQNEVDFIVRDKLAITSKSFSAPFLLTKRLIILTS